MLQRVRARRWIRPGLLLVVLAFCCYALAREWPQVRPALGQLHWYSIAASVVAAMAGAGCGMLSWRTILASFGSKLPVRAAIRVSFVAQLAKYVPGAVWSFAAHVELSHDYQVSRRRGAASVVVSLAVTVAAGLLIAAVALPLASPAVFKEYLLAIAAVPVIAVCLAPPILHRLLNLALRLIRQPPLEQPLHWRALGVALAWSMGGWLLYGVQVWVLLADVAKDGAHSLLLATGAYALAYSLSLLLIVFPSGIGAREFLLVAALAPLLAHGPALAVALVTRVVTTISELAWGGIGVASGHMARRGKHRRQASRPWLRSGPAIDAEHGAGPSVPEVAA